MFTLIIAVELLRCIRNSFLSSKTLSQSSTTTTILKSKRQSSPSPQTSPTRTQSIDSLSSGESAASPINTPPAVASLAAQSLTIEQIEQIVERRLQAMLDDSRQKFESSELERLTLLRQRARSIVNGQNSSEPPPPPPPPIETIGGATDEQKAAATAAMVSSTLAVVAAVSLAAAASASCNSTIAQVNNTTNEET
jgi:hypothetical protein